MKREKPMLSSAGRSALCFFILSIFLFTGQRLAAQRFSSAEEMMLRKKEDSLHRFSDSIVNAQWAAIRLRSDSNFIKTLVRAFKLPNSFYYPFDSLQTISRMYAPDSSFRIFSWQIKKDEYIYLQQGCIQMRTPDGSLRLFGLHDVSMFTAKPLDSIRTPNNWIGAIYYRILMNTYNGRKIYTLLGFDDYSISSNKKWMEILTFDDEGRPHFGGPYFSFRDDSAQAAKMKQPVRFNIEYKKEATATLNYDSSLNMIVFDELTSETEEPTKKDTYVPDGDFEGFKWVDGKWLHVPKVFNYALKDGQFPQDEKLLDESGLPDEQKLMEQSEKNQQKKAKPKTKKSDGGSR